MSSTIRDSTKGKGENDTHTYSKGANSRSRMRIVHMIKHCGHGNGSVHVAVDLACVQARQGDEVTFVSSGGTFEPLLERYGVQIKLWPHEQNRPVALTNAVLQLTRFVHRTHPDVLHAHMMSSAAVGYMVSKMTGVPLVTTVHNSFDKHSVLMKLGRRTVAVSEAERNYLISQGYRGDRIDTVLNGPVHSPREGFFGVPEPLHVEGPAITTVCGLHERKGVRDLIAACAMLFDELPQWKLYIAGEGPAREALEAQVKAAGVEKNVVFLGFVQETRSLFEQSEICVLASYAEPFGLSLVEAMACGCAVVATDVGGMPEIVEYGKSGCLVPPGNPAQLAATLRTLMTNDLMRRQMRNASLERSKRFDVQRLVDGYEQVYLRAGEKASARVGEPSADLLE